MLATFDIWWHDALEIFALTSAFMDAWTFPTTLFITTTSPLQSVSVPHFLKSTAPLLFWLSGGHCCYLVSIFTSSWTLENVPFAPGPSPSALLWSLLWTDLNCFVQPSSFTQKCSLLNTNRCLTSLTVVPLHLVLQLVSHAYSIWSILHIFNWKFNDG